MFFRFGRIVLISLLLLMVAISCKPKLGPGDETWEAHVAPMRKMIDMGAYQMSILDTGKGPAVILIHGFADSIYSWHKNIDALAEAGFRVIAVDLPGLGRSTRPDDDFPLTIKNLSAQIIRLADHLNIEKFNAAGSSMGGGIVLYLSAFYPDRILKAVPVDPACYFNEPPAVLKFLADPTVGKVASPFVGRSMIGFALKDCYFNDALVTDILIDQYGKPLEQKGFSLYLIRLLNEYPTIGYLEMTERYAQIKTPTLLIWGDNDKWVPTKFGPRLHKEMLGSKLVTVKDAGHLPHQEKPAIVNPLLIEFFTEGTELSKP